MSKGNGLPRIDSISVGPLARRKALLIHWKGGGHNEVDISGWIAAGGDILARLDQPETFQKAKVMNYGSAIGWDDGDIAIDACEKAEAVSSPELPT
jgi:hypothetical protein